MKKQLLMAVSILAISAFSMDANAGCDGIYIAARGGIVNHNIGDSSETMGERLDVDDNEWIASGAIGYRWGYFRIEGEYTWRDKSTNEDKAAFTRDEFQTYSYMANLYYDFSPYTMFTPYVMAGLGVTHIDYTSEGLGHDPVETGKDNFTWALGAGLSAKVTNRFNIDAGYRFLNMGTMEEASVRAHEVYLGLRYVF